MSDSQQPAVKLYWLEQSRAQRLVWLFEELHIKYDVEIYRREPTMRAPRSLADIHPLGHSPVVTITPPAQAGLPAEEEKRRIVLAESGFIVERLVEYFPEHGKKLVPSKKWKDGLEGVPGGETEDWMRHQYYMQYVEGSLMPILVIALIIGRLKSTDVPFFVRPITSIVADRVISMFILPNTKAHLNLIEQDLKASSGKYLCGDSLTIADIMLGFPLMAGKNRFNDFGKFDSPDGKWETKYPTVLKYINTLEKEEGYLKSIESIKAHDGGNYNTDDLK